MKTVKHTITHFYYDGVQVFEAHDAIGGHYIAVRVEPGKDGDRFLVAGAEPERLRQFRSGLIDLRSLLTDRAETEWYLGTTSQGSEGALDLVAQNDTLQDSTLLPESGFVLHDQPANKETLRLARERSNLVLEVVVEPPEAVEGHRIHVPTLVGLLAHLQMMVKHAYTSALRDLTQKQRRLLDRSDAHLLDVVVPAGIGSFRVLLEAAKWPDLFGHSEVARALERVDTLFAKVADPQEALIAAKLHKGHFAGSYLRLLRFLVQSKSGLSYSWAEPDYAEPRSGIVTEAEAASIVPLLAAVSNLSAETVTLVGELNKANVNNGTWGLDTGDGEYAGKTKEGGPSLSGLTLGRSYRFTCLEEIEELEVSGHEHRTLYLSDEPETVA